MGILLHCQWECIMVQIIWKMVWVSLIMVKVHLPWDEPSGVAVKLARFTSAGWGSSVWIDQSMTSQFLQNNGNYPNQNLFRHPTKAFRSTRKANKIIYIPHLQDNWKTETSIYM